MNKRYISLGVKGITVFSVILLIGAGCTKESSQIENLPPEQPQDHSSSTTMEHTKTVLNDKDFLSHMIPHHEEAITSARAVIEKTQDEEMKNLLRNIISTQSLEVTQMRMWYKDWFQEEYVPNDQYVAMMRPIEEDIKQIEKNFLEDMTKHHEGAIEKAKSVLTLTKKNEIKSLANHIIESQTEEIESIKTLLDKRI